MYKEDAGSLPGFARETGHMAVAEQGAATGAVSQSNPKRIGSAHTAALAQQLRAFPFLAS